MKRFFLSAFILTLGLTAFAQKNFQGEITYQLHSSKNEGQDALLRILFGENRIKILFREHDQENFDKKEIIVFLDSGLVYTVDREDKNYKRKFMRVNNVTTETAKRNFSGYSASPLVLEQNPLSSLLGGYMETSSQVLYLADSLYYQVPASFSLNEELLAVHNNKIVLGVSVKMRSKYEEEQDSSARAAFYEITATATDVQPFTPKPEEFSIPADYTDRKYNTYEPMVDSARVDTAMVDTARSVIVPKTKTAGKKPAAKKTGPKPAAKKPASPAARRKE